MQANRQQACSIFGLTRREFDQLLVLGFPAKKRSGSRGEDWSVDTVEAFRWLVVQGMAKHGVGGGAEQPADGNEERARRDLRQANLGAGGGAEQPADVNEERARLLRAQANLAEVELARVRVELAPVAAMRQL